MAVAKLKGVWEVSPLKHNWHVIIKKEGENGLLGEAPSSLCLCRGLSQQAVLAAWLSPVRGVGTEQAFLGGTMG